MFERRQLTLTAGILPPRLSIDAKLQNKIIMSVPIRRRKYEHIVDTLSVARVILKKKLSYCHKYDDKALGAC
jgi:hypothetical protein